MNAFSNRHSHRRTGILIVVSLVLIAVAIATVAQNVSTSRRAGDETKSMIVSDISLTRIGADQIQAMVEIKASDDPVGGAQVRARLTVPSDRSYWIRGRTASNGRYVTQFPTSGPGKYTLEITDVSARGLSFDPDGSPSREATLTIGADVATPIPTATADDPTPTEEDSTPTEETPTATEETPTATEEVPTATEEDPTATEEEPTATEEEPTATEEEPPSGVCNMGGGGNTWHAPTDHDHGDAPPQWVTDFSCEEFGHGLLYGGDEQTPNENLNKHRAFKGISGSGLGGDVYFRFHAQSNPHGRQAQYHSFELYVRDISGEVSFAQGWLDFGRFPEDREARLPGGDPADRPAIFGASDAIGSEQWYSRPGGNASYPEGNGTTNELTGAFNGEWYPDTSITFENATTLFSPDEGSYHMDMNQWPVTGGDGTNRLAGVHWYAFRIPDELRGNWFYATQFGQVVDGPQDSLCSGTTTVNGTAYQNKCMPQYIAATFTTVHANPSHNIDCPACVLPN